MHKSINMNPTEDDAKAVQYAEFVADPIEELALQKKVSLEGQENQPHHAVISVRRLQNDTIFPYHTASFCKWFAQKQMDPVSRKQLAYLAPYVQFQQYCLEQFPYLQTLDVTPEFLKNVTRQWWEFCISLTPLEQKVKDLFRAFVDLDTLKRLHMIHVDVDVDEAERLLMKCPVGTWLLRTSNVPSRIPFSDVFTVSGRSLERVVHNRFVYISGVGYYRWNYVVRHVRFVDMFSDGKMEPPVYICLADCLSAMFRLWAPGMLISAACPDAMDQ